MPGPVFREGETVELRTIEKADAAFLQQTINDPGVRTDLIAFEPVNGPEEEDWIESLGDDEGATCSSASTAIPSGRSASSPRTRSGERPRSAT